MTFLAAGVLLFQLSAARQAALKVGTAQPTASKESSSSFQPTAAALNSENQHRICEVLPRIVVGGSAGERQLDLILCEVFA